MELFVEHDRMNRQVRIFLEDKRGDKTILLGYDGKEIVQNVVDNHEFKDVKPFLVLPTDIYLIFVKLIQVQAGKEGIASETESALKGKLEATKEHLEDMRKAFDKLLEKE